MLLFELFEVTEESRTFVWCKTGFIFELLNLFLLVELFEAFEQTLEFLALFFMSIVFWLELGLLLPAICPPDPLKNGTPLVTLFLL